MSLTYHPWAPVLTLAAQFPFQIPACSLGRQSRMAQGLGTLHPHGRPKRSSWLWISSALAVALTWGVNHRTDLPLCLSSSLYRNKHIFFCNRNKHIFFKKKETGLAGLEGEPQGLIAGCPVSGSKGLAHPVDRPGGRQQEGGST